MLIQMFKKSSAQSTNSASTSPAKAHQGNSQKTAGYPDFNLYPAVSKDTLETKTQAGGTTEKTYGYPDFNLYPAVSKDALETKTQAGGTTEKTYGYPDFNLYPKVTKPSSTRIQGAMASVSGVLSSAAATIGTLFQNFCGSIASAFAGAKNSIAGLFTKNSHAEKSYGYPDFNFYPKAK